MSITFENFQCIHETREPIIINHWYLFICLMFVYGWTTTKISAVQLGNNQRARRSKRGSSSRMKMGNAFNGPVAPPIFFPPSLFLFHYFFFLFFLFFFFFYFFFFLLLCSSTKDDRRERPTVPTLMNDLDFISPPLLIYTSIQININMNINKLLVRYDNGLTARPAPIGLETKSFRILPLTWVTKYDLTLFPT